MFFYSITVTQLTVPNIMIVIKFVLTVVLVLQFFLGIYLDFLAIKKPSDQLNDYYSDRSSLKDTIPLLKEIAKAPVKIAIITIMFFIAGTIGLTLTYEYLFHIPRTINLLSFIECIYASYLAAVFAGYSCRDVCIALIMIIGHCYSQKRDFTYL